jgi:hypothetical protein
LARAAERSDAVRKVRKLLDHGLLSVSQNGAAPKCDAHVLL